MKTLFLTIASVVFLTACASQAERRAVSAGAATTTTAAATQQTATAQGAKPTASSGDSSGYEYIIGPGDALDIFVWGYKDLSVTVPVRPDGKITTRLIEDMQASGKTPTVLARDIEKKYVTYVKNPTVTVTVNKFEGNPTQQIKVVGGGAKPKTVPYRNSMTVLDVMIEVGGLSKFSNGNKAVLVRSVNGKSQSYKIRLHNLLKKGDITANRPVQPGDIIIIPESWF